MAARACRDCGTMLPAPSGRGRPRSRCEGCAPRSAPVVLVPAGPDGTIAGAVKAELVAAGRDGSSLGLTALALAEQLDAGGETGSGMATLAKQLGVTLAQATKDAAVVASPLDELRERRRQGG